MCNNGLDNCLEVFSDIYLHYTYIWLTLKSFNTWARASLSRGYKVWNTLINTGIFEMRLHLKIKGTVMHNRGVQCTPCSLHPGSVRAFQSSFFSLPCFSPICFSPEIFSPDIFSPKIFSPRCFSPKMFQSRIFQSQLFQSETFQSKYFSVLDFSVPTFSVRDFSVQVI